MLSFIRPAAFQGLRSSLFKPSTFAPLASVRFNSVNFKISKGSHIYKYLEEGPQFIKFTNEHEWLAVMNDDTAFVGITTYAADALGDATFIELPEVGTEAEYGESIGSVESVKSASEIYSPVDGEILAVNDLLESKPQLINEDPQGNGWIAHIKLSNPADLKENLELLDAEQYEAFLEEH